MTVPGNLSSPLLATAAAAGAASAGPIKSVRFNDDHEGHLTRTPSSAGNRRTWTWAAWVKRGTLGGYKSLFADQVNGGTEGAAIYYNTGDDRLVFEEYSSGGIQWKLRTQQRFRDCSAWHHLTVVFNSPASTADERIRIYCNGSEITDFADRTNPSQNFEGSLNRARITDIASYGAFDTSYFDGYLADIYFIDGSALDPTSFGSFDDNGVWQAAAYSGTFGTNGFHLLDFANESTVGHDSSGNENDFTAVNILPATGTYINAISGTARSGFPFSQMFDGRLDHGALPNASTSYTFTPTTSIPFSTLHIYAYKDSSPGTLKINGTDVTSQVPNHNGIGPNQRTQITGISSPLTSIQNISNGNLANIVFAGLEIDGELLLDKASEVDVLFDVPTDGDTANDTGAGGELSSNYATLNPVHNHGLNLSNGNLDWNGGTSNRYCRPTFFASSGKWYCEFTMQSTSHIPGIIGSEHPDGSGVLGELASSRFQNNGTIGYSGANTVTGGLTWAAGDIVQLYMDMDNKAIYWGVNGTLKVGNDGNTGVPTSGASKTGAVLYGGMSGPTDRISSGSWGPAAGTNGTDTSVNSSVNFGARAFAYSAPSGYKPWCTASLPTPTIPDGSDYFETVLYSGNQTAKSITTGHASDFVWLKVRNQGNNHFLFDSVRGVGRRLMTSGNNDEDGDSSTDTLTSFNSTGFSIGADTATGGVNANSAQMVAWSWVAASSTASNTDGDVTSSVRANQTAGFSIVKWTNNGNNTPSSHRWGHGLGVVPDLVITKRINNTGDWNVYSEVFNNPVRDEIYLNTTAAKHTSGSDLYHRDSTTVGIRAGSIGSSGDSHIAYCFASVAGYSRVGAYEGNSARNFQYLGFQPRWIMIKTISITAYPAYTGWAIFDTERPPAYNVNVNSLFANNTNQEGKRGNNSTASAPDFGIDMLSNGFCLRDNGASEINLNGEDYIYLAFANNPLQANGGLAR